MVQLEQELNNDQSKEPELPKETNGNVKNKYLFIIIKTRRMF